MRSVFVDSSAWIAFFSASDGHHSHAHAAFARAMRERRALVTSSLVVAEVHRQPVRYADAMSFAVMKALRCTIALTFDRHFAMAGFTMWGA